MLFEIKAVYTPIHIVPFVQTVGANATMVEPTHKHPDL